MQAALRKTGMQMDIDFPQGSGTCCKNIDEQQGTLQERVRERRTVDEGSG